MKAKQYSSYIEIETDLQSLKMERELHFQKLKLGVAKTQESLKLGNLIGGYFRFSQSNTSLIGKALKIALPFIGKYILKRRR